MINTKNIFIRPAVPEDALAIKQIHNTAYKISYKGYLPDDFLNSLTIDEDIVTRTRKYLEQAECYVAILKNKTVGFLYVCYPKDDILELQALYIHPSYQKEGIGTALIRNLWKVKKQKYKRYIVWTMKDGPSLNFYKKLGFSMTKNEKEWKFNIPIIMLEKMIL